MNKKYMPILKERKIWCIIIPLITICSCTDLIRFYIKLEGLGGQEAYAL